MRRLALVVALLALGAFGQWALASRRPTSGPMVAEGVFAAFGGLRSLAAEIVWFRADRLQEQGRYVELAQLARALTLSEPHTPEVWSYAAWNLAYNVSLMMPTAEDRWRWVEAAIRLLRDGGLRFNPDSGELHRELAMLFELKLGLDIDSAAAVYRSRWREIVADVEGRGAWSELGMDERRMQFVERRLKFVDRADPYYSAVYWAACGLARAKGADRALTGEILRQSLALYNRNHPMGK